MLTMLVITAIILTFAVSDGLDIRKNCPRQKRGVSCYKACRPDDCLITTKVERWVLKFGDPQTVIQNKSACLRQMAVHSNKKKCFDKHKFNKAITKLTQLFLTHYNSVDFKDNFYINFDGRNGSFVQLKTHIPTSRFTLCTKYSTLSNELTELVSYNVKKRRVWSLAVSSGDKIVFNMQGGDIVFQLPPRPTSSASSWAPPGPQTEHGATLCLAYKSNPFIQTVLWFRYTTGMLTKLSPIKTTVGKSKSYSKGILMLGSSEDLPVQFSGNVTRLSLSPDFLHSVEGVIPFLRCYNDPSSSLRSKIFSSPSSPLQWNDLRERAVHRGGAVTLNMTTEQREQVCGLTCQQCSVRCAGVTDCDELAVCSSCEEHALCLGSQRQPLQNKFKNCDKRKKKKCTVSALEKCITGPTGKNCDVLNCVNDLERCDRKTLDKISLDTLRSCPRFSKIKRKLSPRVPTCEAVCDQRYPMILPKPTAMACQHSLNYRNCMLVCKKGLYSMRTRGMADLGYLHSYKLYGCVLPVQCTDFYKVSAVDLKAAVGLGIKEFFGSDFDMIYFAFSSITEKKLQKMCPDKN